MRISPYKKLVPQQLVLHILREPITLKCRFMMCTEECDKLNDLSKLDKKGVLSCIRPEADKFALSGIIGEVDPSQKGSDL